MKKCPIWQHECYGCNCVSWDEEHNRCNILFMAELGAWYVNDNVINYEL